MNCLPGIWADWRDSEERKLNIEVADRTDFRLWIRQSLGPSPNLSLFRGHGNKPLDSQLVQAFILDQSTRRLFLMNHVMLYFYDSSAGPPEDKWGYDCVE